jgi:hypothetical protein
MTYAIKGLGSGYDFGLSSAEAFHNCRLARFSVFFFEDVCSLAYMFYIHKKFKVYKILQFLSLFETATGGDTSSLQTGFSGGRGGQRTLPADVRGSKLSLPDPCELLLYPETAEPPSCTCPDRAGTASLDLSWQAH